MIRRTKGAGRDMTCWKLGYYNGKLRRLDWGWSYLLPVLRCSNKHPAFHR